VQHQLQLADVQLLLLRHVHQHQRHERFARRFGFQT
jgi:hypothetical protein